MADPRDAVISAARDLLDRFGAGHAASTWRAEAHASVSSARARLAAALRALDAAGPCGDCALPHGAAACHSCGPTLEATIEGAPYVCPGCHAVGAEKCAPGCIDAEIEEERRHALETGDYDRIDGDEEGE